AGGVALARFGLPGVAGGGVVGMRGDPERARMGCGRARRVSARGRGRQRRAGDTEADDERAAALEQIAAGEAKHVDVVHGVAPAILLAASLIAFITRG